MPLGLVGQWVIGGLAFTAPSGAEFKTENGPFAVGVTVKVHFREESDGTRIIREIETEFSTDDNGDDDGDGIVNGNDGHAFGAINALPANAGVGTWTIGGVDYIVTAGTELDDEGVFAVGAQAKIEFFVNASGERVAIEIELTTDMGGVSNVANSKVVGYVGAAPAGGLLVGDWTVNGVALVANAATKFEEAFGLLVQGAYVEVEYAMSGAQRIIIKMESHVPPGAGNVSGSGGIDDKGGLNAAETGAVVTWRIGGVNYQVTPATDLNQTLGSLTVGSTALVNAYRNPDNTLTATRIQGLTITSRVLLPTVGR
jgi:hypothetical protein